MSIINIMDYPQLIKALETKQRIIYLCGAGASMSLGEHRLSWTNWIFAGKDYLSSSDCAELDRRIGSWSSDELINAATFLLKRLKSEGNYELFMDRTIGSQHPTNTVFSEALRTIWRAGDLISTTNYDLLIEESVNSESVSHSTPAEILSVIRGNSDNKVIHLHGVYDKTKGLDDIIADDPQYKGILADAGAQFIQNLIGTHTIIIVGCGGTVEDPNLSGFMNFVVEKLGEKDIPYFYLMKNGDAIPDLPENAKPVIYGDTYTDLPGFLSDLAVLRMKKRVNSQKLISVNPYSVGSIATSAFARMHFSNGFSEFVGRQAELIELNRFLEQDVSLSWWSIIGEGGIGKSRLVLEWLKSLPPHWFGFFTRKLAEEAENFEPFTDTVIVFDYVLGNTHDCAETLKVFLSLFKNSPYKLRILFIERTQDLTEWPEEIKEWLEADVRLSFEAGAYGTPLRIDPLSIGDETIFTVNYLTAYLPLAGSGHFIEQCKGNTEDIGQTIDNAFRSSVEPDCYRPLYLAIFIEVWLEKEGNLSISSSEELMTEYLSKERRRWKSVLDDEDLVDSYMRLLAVACAIDVFNITDVSGNNYLNDDCEKLIRFLDNKSRKPGAKNEFTDLFVYMDELMDDEEGSIFDIISELELSGKADGNDGSEALYSFDESDRFAFSTPYIKLDADPTEVYLQMLVNAEIAEDEEIEQLKMIRQNQAEGVMSEYAWVIEPVLPTIIKEFIVSYVVNDRDVVQFTKLARSNSAYGFQNFLTLALEDKPDNNKFQRMIITPPDEALNCFEYYLSLLIRVDVVQDFKTVEQKLIEIDPCFPKYEIELWKRIAHVLSDRGDMQRLYESGCSFVEYLESLDGLIHVKDETTDVIREYSVGLYNAKEIVKYTDFLQRLTTVDRVFPKNEHFGSVLCECYCLLIHLKLYLDIEANIKEEWLMLRDILLEYEVADDKLESAMEEAYRYLHYSMKNESIEDLYELENNLEGLFEKHNIVKIAEIAAMTTANILTITLKNQHVLLSENHEKLKSYYSNYPQSKMVRSAFISVTKEYYFENSKPKRVPEKLVSKAKKWSTQYPGDIEFQESYFGLLFAKLKYVQEFGNRGEQIQIFKEMKRVAERADYSEYHEENGLLESIEILEEIYGY